MCNEEHKTSVVNCECIEPKWKSVRDTPPCEAPVLTFFSFVVAHEWVSVPCKWCRHAEEGPVVKESRGTEGSGVS